MKMKTIASTGQDTITLEREMTASTHSFGVKLNDWSLYYLLPPRLLLWPNVSAQHGVRVQFVARVSTALL
jgi:hypothetical protein